MATAKEAEEVLKRTQEKLRSLGAHSLHVASGSPFGVRGAVIRAWVDSGAKAALPAEVSATVSGKKVKVPVKVESHERMKPETL